MKRIFTLLGIFLIGFLSVINAQPNVTNITSTNSDATVKITDSVLTITVTFDEAITGVTAPVLSLAFSTGNVNASYDSYSGNDVIFTYTILDNQYAADLDYNGTGALTGTISSASGDNSAVSLPTPGAIGSLSYNKNLMIDSRATKIQNVRALTTASDTYTAIGTIFDITVDFEYPVNVSGKPILYLNTQNSGVYASYLSGSGSRYIVFRYTLAYGDQTVYGDYLDYEATNSLNPNGGSIQYPTGHDVNLILPNLDAGNSITEAGGTPKQIIIDAQKPTVLSVSATAAPDSILTVGESATITVRFSEPVVITTPDALTDRPRLLLETGTVDTLLAGSAGALLETHTFTYTVSEGEESDDLNYKATNSFSIDGNGTIQDDAGNNAILTLPSTYSDSSLAYSDIFVDGVSPTIENITSTARNGSYAPGDSILIQCTFSEPVNSTGLTLDFEFNSDTTISKVVPDLLEASSYSFYYKIGVTNTDTSDLDLVNPLVITGIITDTCGNTLSDSLPVGDTISGSLGKNRNIAIDNTTPNVLSVSVAADSTYGIGKVVIIGVKFDEPVLVTGSPKFQLNSNDTTAFAVYSSGSSRDSLVFRYKVLEGHSSAHLDILDDTTTIDLSSGSITDLAGNATNIDLPDITTSPIYTDNTVIIDGVNSSIIAITGDHTYYNPGSNADSIANSNAGDTVLISVKFNKDIVVTNIPRLILETGNRDRYAIFSKISASNDSIAEFKYAVQVGDTTSALEVKSANALIGGTIKDLLGNPVDRTLTLGMLTTSSITVDGIAPTIINVISTVKNGTYNENSANIDISLVFSEPIKILANPNLILNLNTGGNNTTAYTATGTDIDTLHLTYAIGSSDNSPDLDYTKVIAPLTFNTGTITDANGNALMTTAIPDSGSRGSLGRNKSIVIDTDEPTLDSISCTMADGIYRIGKNLYFTLYFGEKVYVRGKPQIEMNAINSAPSNDSAIYYSGSGTNKIRFRYTVREGFYENTDLNYTGTGALNTTSTDSIYDKAGNKFDLTLPAPDPNGMLWVAGDNLVIDGVKPTISEISGSFDDDLNTNSKGNENDTIIVSILFSEQIVVTGTPRLVMETGRIDRYTTYTGLTGGNTLNFKYGVQEGDETDSLNVKNSRSLNGNIKDVAGNYYIRTTPTTGTALIGSKILVDAIYPTVRKVTSTTSNGYKIAGDNVNVRVEFTEDIEITSGVAQLTLGSGIGTPLLDTNDVNTLNNKLIDFRYQVVADDQNTDLNYASTSALAGNIADTNGNAAILTLPSLTSSYSLAGNRNLYVDALAPSFDVATTPNAIGTYGGGYAIYIKLHYDDKVRVSGRPQFKLNSGSAEYAYYYSGSGTNTLQFKYVISDTATTSGSDLAIDSDISFYSTGAIKDYAGNELVSYAVNGTFTGIKVNGNLKSANFNYTENNEIIEDNRLTELKIDIYPNPVKQSNVDVYLNGSIDDEPVDVKIYNILGNIVAEKRANSSNKISFNNNFKAGIYILAVTKGNEIITNRLIVE